ncbi:MAG TPA: 6-phosphogluconolactonase, partial [Thermoanaerobaculia bacterium]|nr:6-phosphogluconolactonase [Thermoanaerobaculia bacterium]
QLDLAILGVGEDGHTASLFPDTSVLEIEDVVAAAVYVPRLSQWRVTLTMPVIRSAGMKIVQAAGESKAAIMREIASGADVPVVRATAGEGTTWWFIDRRCDPTHALND